MPPTATPQAELTYLDKRLFCQLRDGLILHLGLLGATSIGSRTPPEFVTFQAGDGVIQASLIRVTPRMVFYRQVMRDGATNFDGSDRINDQQR